ncbi:MAG TPA: M48 family metalloprotease [Terriglobales bacterium]|nr:M48 family metalloprotease [Terriglobales bacterium]
MKRKFYLGIVVVLLLGGIAVSQWRKPAVKASPDAVLYFIGDTEHELSRMPARFTRMSDAEEVALGNHLASYLPVITSLDNPDVIAVQEYVSRVGLQVAAHAHRKLPYKFHYIPQRSFVNAYALPGGHVVIGAGMIELMDSEDELASVLGHEIEHIDHYQCAERAQTEQTLHRIPLASLAALPVEIFQAGYSKTDELEADREGVRLAALAGYSPEGAIRLFETFDRLYHELPLKTSNPEQEVSAVVIEGISGYFRSHPMPADRVEQIRTMIASEHLAVPKQEKPLLVQYIFATRKARDSFDTAKYEEAVRQTSVALSLNPDYVPARKLRAQSEFLLARFSDAASDYAQLMKSWQDIATVDAFADSLAAAKRDSAASEFEQSITNLQAPVEAKPLIDADLAGLRLLGGSSSPAEQLTEAARKDRQGDVLARIGKWSYRAGNFDQAAELLQSATELRPETEQYHAQLRWAQIEQGKFESALKQNSYGNESSDSMSRAVALWQAHDQDAALLSFNSVLGAAPYWKNPAWTRALYAADVTETIQQMQHETERRKEAALKHSH